MMKKRNITIIDIAKEAGVSPSTISNILNNKKKASEETRVKVMKIIEKYNFSPSISASTLVNKKSHLIAVIVPFVPTQAPQINHNYILENPFYTEFISGAEFQARKLDKNILITTLSLDEDLKIFGRRNLEGGIIIGALPPRMLKKIRTINSKIVLIDSYDYEKEKLFYRIYSNDEKGGYLATRHLLENGHKNIAFVSGQFVGGENVFKKRYNGYVRALEEAGIEVNTDYIVHMDNYSQAGTDTIEVLKKHKEITAVFATGDIFAFEILRHLRENNIDVPGDISVIGFDDLLYCNFVTPRLTTIKQDIFQKGIAAINVIAENNSELEISMDVELIIRDSVRKI